MIFFACFYSLYLLLQRVRSVRPQNLLLLLASNVFYGAWDVRFLALLWFSALIDFFVAQRIETATDQRTKPRPLRLKILITPFGSMNMSSAENRVTAGL